jgi:putative membrane protein
VTVRLRYGIAMTDLALAILHHFLAFGLLGVLAAEVAITAPGLGGARLRRLQQLDRMYGLVAVLLIAVGVLRVLYGGKGAEFYLASPAFWAKMAAFAAVGLLSIAPTIRIIGWSRKARADAAFAVPEAEVAAMRKWFAGQLLVFPLILLFAAMMARGVWV